jgi:hypothetical protein
MMHSLTLFVQRIDLIILLDARMIVLLKTELVFWPRPLLARWVRFRVTVFVFAMDRGWNVWGVWSCGVLYVGWRWGVCLLFHCRLGVSNHFQRSFYTVTCAVTEGFMVRAFLPPLLFDVSFNSGSMATANGDHFWYIGLLFSGMYLVSIELLPLGPCSFLVYIRVLCLSSSLPFPHA